MELIKGLKNNGAIDLMEHKRRFRQLREKLGRLPTLEEAWENEIEYMEPNERVIFRYDKKARDVSYKARAFTPSCQEDTFLLVAESFSEKYRVASTSDYEDREFKIDFMIYEKGKENFVASLQLKPSPSQASDAIPKEAFAQTICVGLPSEYIVVDLGDEKINHFVGGKLISYNYHEIDLLLDNVKKEQEKKKK